MEEDGTYQPGPQKPSGKATDPSPNVERPSSSDGAAGVSDQHESEQRTLADIREAIAECDALRLDPDLTDADRSSLERTALTLRSVERELIEATSETVLDRLEAASKPLEDLARDIRTRVTAMNAPARTLEHFKRLASLTTRILREVGRW